MHPLCRFALTTFFIRFQELLRHSPEPHQIQQHHQGIRSCWVLLETVLDASEHLFALEVPIEQIQCLLQDFIRCPEGRFLGDRIHCPALISTRMRLDSDFIWTDRYRVTWGSDAPSWSGISPDHFCWVGSACIRNLWFPGDRPHVAWRIRTHEFFSLGYRSASGVDCLGTI